MLRDKYAADVERCERIGGYINHRIYVVFDSRKEVSRRFAELTGVGPHYAYTLLKDYCEGGILACHFSSDSRVRAGAKPEVHAMRLAVLFTILGIEEGDPVVALAREVNPRFAYPITLEEPQGYLRPEVLSWIRNLNMV